MADNELSALFGLSENHLTAVDPHCLVHQQVLASFLQLREAAAEAGHGFAIASGFRSFKRQLAIWNAKATGQRSVLDSNGNALNVNQLSPRERVFAILRWSALPGASRHHWGTDMDIWDPTTVPTDYQLRLVPAEYQAGGPFAELSLWLDQQIIAGNTEFYRPYGQDLGGVAPEPWHLSFRPVAEQFAECLTVERLAQQLESVDIALKDVVLANLDEIFERFIQVG